MIDKIVNFFKNIDVPDFLKDQINNIPNPLNEDKISEIDEIKIYINKIDLLSKRLSNISNIASQISKHSKLLIESNPERDLIHLLHRYLPIIIRIIEEHVSYNEKQTNNLDIFWNNIKSKDILIRFLNKLTDQSKSIKEHKIQDFSAELSAFDHILKTKGY
ncbi:MAG: hypothetical protein IJU76_13945 [Desulfovibrionaceae bacterium]|nr:hypothetical protein [Desulfovibrionaceae bacterium]